ncbi:hypothetical protein GCM10023335_55990 [Streptomyces siamensis]|uniref:Uncharacterized protein n=1 Tax=Streptomyces siamensis TaxID=1274986 RepID=A0ABP9J7Q2_9ACTN
MEQLPQRTRQNSLAEHAHPSVRHLTLARPAAGVPSRLPQSVISVRPRQVTLDHLPEGWQATQITSHPAVTQPNGIFSAMARWTIAIAIATFVSKATGPAICAGTPAGAGTARVPVLGG